MEIKLNGDTKEINEGLTVAALVTGEGISEETRVAVLVNGDIVSKDDRVGTTFQAGDQVEIISIAAGG